MPVNPLWARWCRASLNTFFDSEFTLDMPVFYEGAGPRNPEEYQGDDWVDLRVDGPRFRNGSRSDTIMEVYLSAICFSRVLDNGDNYRIHDTTGMIENILDKCIPFMNYTDPDNPVFVDRIDTKRPTVIDYGEHTGIVQVVVETQGKVVLLI